MSKASSFFVLGLLIGAASAAGWFAWLGQQKESHHAGAKVLKIAHSLPLKHPVHSGLLKFQQRVEELSGGSLKIQVFPNGQLGTETQCLEKVQSGSLDITKVSAAPIGNFVPAYKVFSLPYLFRDAEHYWKVLNGPVGEQMLEVLGTRGDGSPSGLKGIGYFDAGSRSFYTVKPVRSPADLAGKKIRVMSDQVAMDMVQAMGGAPTAIAFGELYTALKQGTVDGAENNPPSFVSSRHYEICKHYVLDHHARIPDVIVISSDLWQSLNRQQRDWIMQAMKDAEKFQRELWNEETARSLQQLRDEGVTVVEPDLEPFRNAVSSMVGKYVDKTTGPLIESIQNVR